MDERWATLPHRHTAVAKRASSAPFRHTVVTHSARFGALTSCTEIPNVTAITSGIVTSFVTKTESDDTSAHVESEKVAFLTIKSTAR